MSPTWLALKTVAACDCRGAPPLLVKGRQIYPHSARVEFLDGAIDQVEILGLGSQTLESHSQWILRAKFEAEELIGAPAWVRQLVDQAAEQMLRQSRLLMIHEGELGR